MNRRRKVSKEEPICIHGRDAWADDCGMCDGEGTDWAMDPQPREELRSEYERSDFSTLVQGKYAMTTKVVNARTHTPTENDVYIGRPGPWSNPFLIGRDGGRREVIKKHLDITRERLVRNPHMLNSLIGKKLVCYCSPKPCHGDNFILLLKEQGKIP